MDACPQDAISIRDTLDAYNAVIDPQRCIDCGACTRVCQYHNPPVLSAPIAWYQGWASDAGIRSAGSSGGLAGALTESFLRTGGAVCSCVFESGRFVFRMARSQAEAATFAGSRYIKSEPSGIYRQVLQLLKENTPVLFIGLPCQCAGVRQFVGAAHSAGLYTVDLICHGSPSPKLLDAFLQQYGLDATMLQQPRFRHKGNFCFSDPGCRFSLSKTRDPYTLAFLNMLIYTENCYHCPYARIERVSDLTLGDSWGSKLPAQELKKGISLVSCQTQKGQQLLGQAALTLQPVELQTAIENNHQLQEPSPCPPGRKDFFLQLQKGRHFNALVRKNFPKQYLRQKVKGILYQLMRR